MAKRVFRVEYSTTIYLELDEAVINAVDDEWRKELYDLRTPEQIAEMIGRCMIFGDSLSSLDGWANQPNKNARVITKTEEETEATEIHRPIPGTKIPMGF